MRNDLQKPNPESHESPKPQATTREGPALPAKALDGFRILLVEDSYDLRLLIGRKLRAYGACLEEASDGREALDRLQTEPFDIVLMDIQMPGIDGLEACERLRRQGYRKPVVAMSAHTLEQAERAKASGFDAFLSKSSSTEILLSTLTAFKKSS